MRVRERKQKLNKNALTLPLVREIRKLRERKWHATKRNRVKEKRKKQRWEANGRECILHIPTHIWTRKKKQTMHSHATYQYKNIENIFSLSSRSLRLCVCHLRLFVCLCYPWFVLQFPHSRSKFYNFAFHSCTYVCRCFMFYICGCIRVFWVRSAGEGWGRVQQRFSRRFVVHFGSMFFVPYLFLHIYCGSTVYS